MHRYLTLFIALTALGLNWGCGGGYGSGNNGGSGTSAAITNPVAALQPGATYDFSATTPNTNGYTAGISWSISPPSGAGTLSNAKNSGYSSTVVYMAPMSMPNPNSVTITATPMDSAVKAATDTFTISTSAPPSPYSLSGPFAFALSGFDASSEAVNIAGSITADGSGRITAGSMDLRRGIAPATFNAPIAGTYSFDSKLKGIISLTTEVPGVSHPLAFAFTLAADTNSGALTGSDTNGFQISGTFRRQDKTAFSLAKISGDFAFKLESDSPGRVASVGKLTIGENSNIAGLADSSTAGVGPLLTGAPMAGRITAAPDANGRGTLILATSAGVPHFAFYVVSEKSLLLIGTDSANAGSAPEIGVAARQMLPFTPAITNASSVFRAAGFDQNASAPGPVSVTGRLTIENLTHATIDWDASVAGDAFSQTGLRSEVVAFDPATGRGTIQIANGYSNNFADSVVFYLAASSEGFLLDTTEGRFNRSIVGDLRPVTSLTDSIAVSGTVTSESH